MVRRHVVIGQIVALVACFQAASSHAEGPPQELVDQLGQADRVLIAMPKETTKAAGGEAFRIEIGRLIRGNGKKGVLLTVVNSGDAQNYPRYKAGQQYVFLLKKSPDGPRFVSLSTLELPVHDGRVVISHEGEKKQEISLEDFEDQVARTTPKVVDANARTTTLGRWVYVVSKEGVDLPISIFEFSKGDKPGRHQAKMLATARFIRAASLESAEVDDGSVHLVFIADGGIVDFRGRLRDGGVFGDVFTEEFGIKPARLIATEATTMGKREEPQRAAGVEEFVEAMNQDHPEKALGRFVRRYPESPLAIDAWRIRLREGSRDHADRAVLEPIAEGFIAASTGWGDRIGLEAYVHASRLLSRNEHLPALALKYQAAAKERFTDDTPDSWRLIVGIDYGKSLALTGKDAEGLAIWKNLLETHPFEPELMGLLARQLEKAGQIDEALSFVAQIVALPMLEPMVIDTLSTGKRLPPRDQRPSGVLERLWKKQNGKTSGLEQFVNETFDKAVRGVAGEMHRPRKPPEGSRVVLCELFTGASCDPCSGADFVTTALEAAFSQSEVIVLRYHVHHPRPDPLANDETNKRYDQYDEDATPAVYVNGRSFDRAGGFMPQVTGNYRRLVEEVEPYLVEKTDLKLELSAKMNQGKIAISAGASGMKSFPQDLRMRLVLAEDRVPYRAPNGINVHEMLVRTMPGGVDGVAPVKGKLEFKEEIDLARLRTRLTKHLKRIETEAAVDFPEKPFDFKAMHLVAFLQDTDGEVLQAAAIPVAGMELTPQDRPPAAKKPAGSGPPATGGN